MIDLEFAKREFKDYLKPFDVNNPKIALKITHTYKVVSSAEYICENLKLNEEDSKLASLIALLHDIGRFKQIELFDDYSDNKIDHADLGVKILFEDGLIRKFIKDESYDSIIKNAIANHNRYKIDEEGLSEREILHAKIIRDADKLDNFRVKEKESFVALFGNGVTQEVMNNLKLTDKTYNSFMKKELVLKSVRETYLDYWVSYIAFIFDLNFKESLDYIRDNNYINILVDRIDYKDEETKRRMEDVRNISNEYVKNYR